MRQVQRVPQHRAQRRDAGPAGDEDEAPFGGVRRKGEASDRTLDVHERARLEAQMRSGRALGSTPTSSSRQPSRSASSGADGDRVRLATLVPVALRPAPPVRAVTETAAHPGRAGRCGPAAWRAAPPGCGSVSSTEDYAIARDCRCSAARAARCCGWSAAAARDDRSGWCDSVPCGLARSSAAASMPGGWRARPRRRRDRRSRFLDGIDRSEPGLGGSRELSQ